LGFGVALGFKAPTAIGNGANDCAYDGHEWPADKQHVSLVPDVLQAVVPPSVKAEVGVADLARAKVNVGVSHTQLVANVADRTEDLMTDYPLWASSDGSHGASSDGLIRRGLFRQP
jgi:hypothetical protein